MKIHFTRLSMVVVIAILGATTASADVDVRIAPVVAADFAVRPKIEDLGSMFNEQGNLFWGPQVEIITDRVGFGFRGLVDFNSVETGSDDPRYDWSLDWLGDLFMSYHPFGIHSFIDPFVEVGIGNAGRVNLDDSDSEWDYENYVYSDEDDALESLALYPNVAAGISLDLGGLFVGAKLAYRPTVIPIPATQFEVYPVTNFQLSIFGGVTLGD